MNLRPLLSPLLSITDQVAIMASFYLPACEDIQKILSAQVHIGTRNNSDSHMQDYIWRRRQDGIRILNIGKTWEKLVLAARIIVAVENSQDVVAISARPYGERAVLKFAQYTGCLSIASRFTPGTFTNEITKQFREPRIFIITDPRPDAQAVNEASYVNVPVIAFCDSDSPLQNVDMPIPSNNKENISTGFLYWLLAREVLRMRGTIDRQQPWDVLVDLFFYREPEELEKRKRPRRPSRSLRPSLLQAGEPNPSSQALLPRRWRALQRRTRPLCPWSTRRPWRRRLGLVEVGTPTQRRPARLSGSRQCKTCRRSSRWMSECPWMTACRWMLAPEEGGTPVPNSRPLTTAAGVTRAGPQPVGGGDYAFPVTSSQVTSTGLVNAVRQLLRVGSHLAVGHRLQVFLREKTIFTLGFARATKLGTV